MSPVINSQYSSLPPLEGNQDQTHLIPFFPSYETSSFQYPISYQPSNTEAYGDHQDHDRQQQEVDDDHFAAGGSSDSLLLRISMPASNDESEGDNKSTKRYASDTPPKNKTAKWMSSKMRLMRKMMNSYPHQQVQQTSGDSCNSNSSSNGLVRVCSDCNTTKTPLWRTGPQGPKSLCNACGIRQRKARKAMAAAAAAAMNGDLDGTGKGSDTCNAAIPYKKRYKLEETRKKIKLEDFSISLKKKTSTFHPQDEKEAAILLMALSCDLIYG